MQSIRNSVSMYFLHFISYKVILRELIAFAVVSNQGLLTISLPPHLYCLMQSMPIAVLL